MFKSLKKKSEGFTIIEVLIVLAIAGLIMLVVFLAVPALQRNARNTQRKSDVGRVGSAAQEVVSNNNGDLTKLTNTTIQASVGKNLAYYTNTSVTIVTPTPAVATNNTNADSVMVYKSATCAAIAAGGLGATKTGASTRGIAVTYSVETGSGTAKNCINL